MQELWIDPQPIPPTRGIGVRVAAGYNILAGLPELAAEARRGEDPGGFGGEWQGHGVLVLDGHERIAAWGLDRVKQGLHIGELVRLDIAGGGGGDGDGAGAGKGEGLLVVVAGEIYHLGGASGPHPVAGVGARASLVVLI